MEKTQCISSSDFRVLTAHEIDTLDPTLVFNVNIGIMGHIDSGKTSVCRVISKITSTASLDKNPQSQERGITIDIGFSSFSVELSSSLADHFNMSKKFIQFTLVDCPGHAAFMKSVIAGSNIIDLMILIVDVKKGLQIQTAECLALGEIMRLPLIVMLNKVDQLTDEERNGPASLYEKTSKMIFSLLQKTGFPNKSQLRIIPFSCNYPESEMYHN
jgi:selenocysteine-specific elongation factor